jgi:hypothetical protein
VRAILAILFLVLLLLPGSFLAQSPYASVVGIVFDPDSKTIPGAEIIVVNDVTRVQYQTKTNNDGIYAVPNLPPGPYRVQVSKVGFKTIIKPDIVLNVQDSLSVNFTLPIGATSVTVTVEGGAPLINTQSAAVSTVVDRNFVENMPLNGRSFQDLILLTPGIVTNSPQATSFVGYSGEFSVNGQRTESNYYSVDGVSANTGTFPIGFHVSMAGALPTSTALGTTQGLVPVDALQEFRVQSSSYSAEYGRDAGGQFSFVTRSGTNQWHGSVFEYLRNDIFDANDWFNNYLDQSKPALRQNDFGGTLGGRLKIPGLYDGKDKTFFFFSYEGLRLLQPQASTISYVPTVALRASAVGAMQAVLNAFPLPYCPPNAPGCTEDLGNGLGDAAGTWSNPSSIDSYGLRLDHVVNARLKLFFRFADTRSTADARSTLVASNVQSSSFHSRAYTSGVTILGSSMISDELRVNYSSNRGTAATQIDSFGGAVAVDLAQLQGIDTQANPFSGVSVGFILPGYTTLLSQSNARSLQRQWNVTDNVNVLHDRHQLKFGMDYRRLTPVNANYNPNVSYYFFSASSIQANSTDFGSVEANSVAHPLYTNFSAFAQDEWKIRPRLNISMGVRWDVNPAPGVTQGLLPYTVAGADNFATMTLAPQGTALWSTTWYNFAPRLGAAYVLRNTPGHETVLRGGGGVFFDSGQQDASIGYYGPGLSATQNFGGLFGSASPFPAPLSQFTPPLVNPPVPPYGIVYAFPPHRQLPYTIQWNAAMQQALGRSQTVTVSYVGAHAGRLLEQNQVNVQPFNANFTDSVLFLRNGLTSDYDALQIQFQRKLNQDLQALASYTWSHCLDYGSQDLALPYQRGNCDFDVRHNLSAALTYDLPHIRGSQFSRAVLGHWGMDARFSIRTGFPVTLQGQSVVDPATGNIYNAGLNIVPGQPPYLDGPQYPGGRSINAAAFVAPAAGELGNAPRNFVWGFGAWQTDFAVRREIPIHERLKLQFRAEAFNVFNHANFGTINTTFGNAQFGQATQTLSTSLGVLSPLYQAGGPRSVQLALRMTF